MSQVVTMRRWSKPHWIDVVIKVKRIIAPEIHQQAVTISQRNVWDDTQIDKMNSSLFY